MCPVAASKVKVCSSMPMQVQSVSLEPWRRQRVDKSSYPPPRDRVQTVLTRLSNDSTAEPWARLLEGAPHSSDGAGPPGSSLLAKWLAYLDSDAANVQSSRAGMWKPGKVGGSG